MFGRLIDVSIITPNLDEILIVNHKEYPNTYNCSMTINKVAGSECDRLELMLYNLPATLRGTIALNKDSLILVKFGYADEGGGLQVIFKGNITRTLSQRPDGVTTALKIYALDSGEFKASSFFSKTFDDANYYTIAYEIGKQAQAEGNISGIQLSEKLKEYAINGSKAFFTGADNAMQEIASECNAVYFKSDDTLNLLLPEEIISQNSAVDFTVYNTETGKIEAASGMIKIPRLTDNGVEVDCLINPLVKIYGLIKVDNAVVSIEQSGAIPSSEYGAALDPDGIYVVTSITMAVSNMGENNTMTINAFSRSVFLEQYAELEES